MTAAAAACKSAHMDEQQEATRRFLRELLRATGWAPSKLAREAGVAHTTLSRFLNDEEVTHTLSARTIDKIRRAATKIIPRDQIDGLWLLSQRTPVPERSPRHME